MEVSVLCDLDEMNEVQPPKESAVNTHDHMAVAELMPMLQGAAISVINYFSRGMDPAYSDSMGRCGV